VPFASESFSVFPTFQPNKTVAQTVAFTPAKLIAATAGFYKTTELWWFYGI
jgi:hypothetical protein